jgi:PadR family transcriptional regulator, regulatory protein PadR
MSMRPTSMREPTYLVLASLLDGPLPGFGIIRRAEELSGGRVRLATGTVYTALDRLTGEGYVSLVSEQRVAGRVRRNYGVAVAFLTALHAEAMLADGAARGADAAGRRNTTGRIVVVGGRVRVGGKVRRR